MNYNDDDGELAALIEENDMVIPDDDNGRVNPVFRPVQPRVILAPGIQRDNNMLSNGGRKKKRTSKNSRKYKNKNHKYKNRKHQTRKTRRVIKKRK
jgi:hypothetical protein